MLKTERNNPDVFDAAHSTSIDDFSIYPTATTVGNWTWPGAGRGARIEGPTMETKGKYVKG